MVWNQTLSLTGFHIHIYELYELPVKFISKLYKTKRSDKIGNNHGVINSLNNDSGWSYNRYNRKRYCIWKLFALYRLSNRNKKKLCGPSLHELWCRLQLPNALSTYFQVQENEVTHAGIIVWFSKCSVLMNAMDKQKPEW